MNAIPNHIPVTLVSIGSDGSESKCQAWANPDSGAVKTFINSVAPASERYVVHEDEYFLVREADNGELVLDNEDLGEFRSVLNG